MFKVPPFLSWTSIWGNFREVLSSVIEFDLRQFKRSHVIDFYSIKFTTRSPSWNDRKWTDQSPYAIFRCDGRNPKSFWFPIRRSREKDIAFRLQQDQCWEDGTGSILISPWIIESTEFNRHLLLSILLYLSSCEQLFSDHVDTSEIRFNTSNQRCDSRFCFTKIMKICSFFSVPNSQFLTPVFSFQSYYM